MTKNRPPTAGSFPKGKSGNPGGRAKKTPEEFELIEACKLKSPAALQTILTIMESGDGDKVRLSAAQYVIDRGYGKAKQEQDVNVSGEIGIRNIRVEFVDAAKR
jgi:hypothetical protein